MKEVAKYWTEIFGSWTLLLFKKKIKNHIYVFQKNYKKIMV
jgi:hypothetical protein